MLEIMWQGRYFHHIRHSQAEVRAAEAVEQAAVRELRQVAEFIFLNRTGKS
jgi:hypothetical protein